MFIPNSVHQVFICDIVNWRFSAQMAFKHLSSRFDVILGRPCLLHILPAFLYFAHNFTNVDSEHSMSLVTFLLSLSQWWGFWWNSEILSSHSFSYPPVRRNFINWVKHFQQVANQDLWVYLKYIILNAHNASNSVDKMISLISVTLVYTRVWMAFFYNMIMIVA